MFRLDVMQGFARTGELSSASGVIKTPGFFVYTRRGGALNLTSDILSRLDIEGVQVDVLHFLKQPEPSVLASYKGGGRKFLGAASGCVLIATGRDPTVYEYSGALRQASDDWASIVTHSGGGRVTPSQYMAAVSALQPDVFVALSDEVPCDCKQQRASTAVTRTVAWLQECSRLKDSATELQHAAMFAAVQGGQHMQEREKCTAGVAALPGVTGFAIGGLGTGESTAQRRQILRQAAAGLPPDKPRLVMGIGTPEEVLEAVAEGVDLFDMGYLAQVTAGGYALGFPLSPSAAADVTAGTGAFRNSSGSADDRNSPEVQSSSCNDDISRDHTKMNLWSLKYRDDAQPLLPGCSCFACQNHTRAYIHHLLQAHEMLAQVLLELHNTHHYQRWFAELRRVICAGQLSQYSAWFLERARQEAIALS